MIMTWVSKICDFVSFTYINRLLQRQAIIPTVLIYDAQAVCNANSPDNTSLGTTFENHKQK